MKKKKDNYITSFGADIILSDSSIIVNPSFARFTNPLTHNKINTEIHLTTNNVIRNIFQ